MGRVYFGFYKGVTESLCDWVINYAKYDTKDSEGYSRRLRHDLGGSPAPTVDIINGTHYLINMFFRLRGFTGGHECPITPGLINDLGEYVSPDDRAIIEEMDKAYRGEMPATVEYLRKKK